MQQIFLGLGANIGDAKATLLTVIDVISERFETDVEVSHFYKSAAWGKTDQDDFINCCVGFRTNHSAIKTLEMCQAIENEYGRQRHEHWGPRTIDIDILFYGNEIIQTEQLDIPHPYIQDRSFVLLPLNDIASECIHPRFNRKVHDLLNECKDKTVIERINA